VITTTIRISTAIALIVGAGWLDGKWTGRWGPPPELTALAARVDAVPLVLGDWKGEAFELPAPDRAAAGAVACLARRYTNPRRGVTVTALLLGGLPGKIATHTPDICYPAAGYSLESPVPFVRSPGPDGRPAGFRTALATRLGPSPSTLRIFWGWNAAGGWAAPDEPRWAFGPASALCKLYVIRETAGTVVKPEDDPCNDFLDVFLPELDRRVFAVSR
jgi:hypothetical protein